MSESVFALMDALTAVMSPLKPLAEKTVVLHMPALQDALRPYAAPEGPVPLDFDVMKYLLAMMMAYPLAVVFSLLPSSLPLVKNAFSLFTGVLLTQFVFGWEWVHPLAAALGVYAIVALTAPIKALDGVRHLLVFSFMLGYMTLAHLFRLYHDYMGWSLDITGPLMILTIKLTAFGYNYYDGVTNKAVVDDKINNGSPGARRMYQEFKDCSISGIPDPIEYLGWVFCFTTFFAGPAFELREYQDAVRRPASESAKLPSRALTVLKCFAGGVLFLAATGYGQAQLPMLVGSKPDVVVNPDITEQPTYLLVVVRALLTLFFVRVKYYFAWLISEGSAVLAGFGYRGGEKNDWNGVSNVDVLGFEFASNLDNGARAWNQRTQTWLARYVYKRASRSYNMLLTYFISAFWHGFYPGYYLFFLSVPLFQTFSKRVNSRVRPHTFENNDVLGKPKSWKFIYDIIGTVITHCTLNYLASVFVVLGWHNALTIWGSYKYAGHIILAISYVPLILFFPSIRSKKKGE